MKLSLLWRSKSVGAGRTLLIIHLSVAMETQRSTTFHQGARESPSGLNERGPTGVIDRIIYSIRYGGIITTLNSCESLHGHCNAREGIHHVEASASRRPEPQEAFGADAARPRRAASAQGSRAIPRRVHSSRAARRGAVPAAQCGLSARNAPLRWAVLDERARSEARACEPRSLERAAPEALHRRNCRRAERGAQVALAPHHPGGCVR